jgi:hypothetical protein
VIEGARWAKLDQLLDAALERPVGERRSFLESACSEDGELREEALRLLALAEADDRELRPGAVAASAWDDDTALGDAAGTIVPELPRGRSDPTASSAARRAAWVRVRGRGPKLAATWP